MNRQTSAVDDGVVAKLHNEDSSRLINDLRKGKNGKKQRTLVTLVLCGVFPRLCLFAVVFYQLARAVEIKNNAENAKEDTEYLLQMEKLFGALQRESLATRQYLRWKRVGVVDPAEMMEFRNLTNTVVKDLRWPDKSLMEEYVSTKEKFMKYLSDYRQKGDNGMLSDEKCELMRHLLTFESDVASQNLDELESMKFYVALTKSIVNVMNRLINLPNEENLWSMAAANNFLLLAGEAVLSEASVVRSISYTCVRTKETLYWLQNLIGEYNATFKEALVYYPPLVINYTDHYLNSSNMERVEETRRIVMSDNFTEMCRVIPENERRLFNFTWFAAFYNHYVYLVDMRSDLTGMLMKGIDDVIDEAQILVVIYIVVSIVMPLVNIITLIFQIKSVNSLVNNLEFTEDSKIKTELLAAEEKKGLTLLCQIMPKPVAQTMRDGQQVAPAQFDNATICYIDIVGFMTIISRLEAVQVTNLLGRLYGMYDSLLEVHKLHKVEQTNDVYCVIGGVPDRTSTHATDVANYAIQLMWNFKRLKIDELPNVNIQIRCGVHTGPCAAGVVGLKSKRYSIFGESVKMASRMSRTGEVERIQISHSTRAELIKSKRTYEIIERGFVDVSGIGKVTTYFLEGFGDSPNTKLQNGLQTTDL